MSRSIATDGMTPTVPAVGGYLHPLYAASLAEFGTPRELPRSGGWILERRIEGSSQRDAMGCYPLFACRDWSRLRADVDGLGDELVSLTVVTDPFGAYDETLLRQCFADLVVRFKEHFVVALDAPPDSFVESHHRRNARKALQSLRVERCDAPSTLLDEWCEFYANLIARHDIRGLTAFSRASFAKQLNVPGIVAFRATHEGRGVGMTLWYAQGDAGYYHLGAYSDEGYELRASFALFWSAIEHFASAGLRHLNLGAGAGAGGDGTDGLSRFKRGWATGKHPTYLCGRIFDRERYDAVARARGAVATSYFPAYRAGEFA